MISLRLSKPNVFIFLIATTIIVMLYSCLPNVSQHHLLQHLRKKSTTPSPVVFLPFGGLGNQLFHYAAAYSLAKTRNSDLYICLPSNWETPVEKVLQFYASDRSYLLWAFNTSNLNILISNDATCTDIIHLTEVKSGTELYLVNENVMLSKDTPMDKVMYMLSNFESEIFFKAHASEIVRELTLNMNVKDLLENSIKEYASMISATESVAVHIKIADFVSENHLIPMTYYQDAINRMKLEIAKRGGGRTKEIIFFIFSDDIATVKSFFRSTEKNVVFVSNKDLSRLADFMLMRMCKHIITANSTFSWWAAYLNDNKNKIIIAPSPELPPYWFELLSMDKLSRDIFGGFLSYPDKWITINPFKS